MTEGVLIPSNKSARPNRPNVKAIANGCRYIWAEPDASVDEALAAATPAGGCSTQVVDVCTWDATKAVPVCSAPFCIKKNYNEGVAEPTPYEGNGIAGWISFCRAKESFYSTPAGDTQRVQIAVVTS